MSLFQKIKLKAATPVVKMAVKAVYDATLQSPTGKKAQRWLPLGGSFLYLVVTAMRVAGIAGSETALEWLRYLHVPSEISETELTIATTTLLGLANKFASMVVKAQGEVVPPNSPPITQTRGQWEGLISQYQMYVQSGKTWEEARRLAFVDLLSAHAPVPIDRQKFKETAVAEAQAATTEAKK